ncbi:hypothetical protein [Maricaulis maris]|uniref:hypothetical protein n=1 Tax=Maricaulis maris TaxID=74318 RepID=UPI003A8E2456
MTCRKILSAVTLASTLCLAGFAGAQAPNSMLARYGDEFRTLHTLTLRIGADDSLTAAGPTDRSAVFNDVPFDISLAAFIADDQAIMVHAEQVADGSGAANYTRYELSEWPIPGFRLKPLDCLEVSAEIVNSEHDLAWLREHGFNPAGVIWIEQYFLSDDSFNNEVVISLLVRGSDCDAEPASRFAELRSALQIHPHHD